MKNSLLILSILVLISCGQKEPTEVLLPYYSQADFTPVWMDPDDSDLEKVHTIAPFSFTNQDGKTVTQENLKGHIYVANFFFSICPSVCPRMTNNLQRVQAAFEQDDSVLLVSHSVMPWVDSVSVLKEYAQRNDIQSGKWHLLTGEKREIYELGRSSYFADEGFGKSVTEESDFLHTENVVLVDPNLRIRGVYNGTIPLEMARLIEDVERLKREQYGLMKAS
ncbi:MAG: SCO family protein [Cyclobacteriaceae bacterium]